MFIFYFKVNCDWIYEYIIGAAITRACISVLVGAKRQKNLLMVNIIGMICLCVPLSLTFCFVFDYGFKGLYIGFVLSYIVQSVCFSFFCMTINWEKEIELAATRLALLKNSLNNYKDDFE